MNKAPLKPPIPTHKDNQKELSYLYDQSKQKPSKYKSKKIEDNIEKNTKFEVVCNTSNLSGKECNPDEEVQPNDTNN